MNKGLQRLVQIIHKDDSMTSAQKKEAVQSLKVVEKELKAALLKSGRKKTKHTTEVLLKEALTEPELKRKEVAVKDRGNGVPQSIKEKIFQPFFTTKPTGQGTGLGLSLSYDIVKAHGGELKVTTREGSGSEFIITLPT